MPNLGIEIEDEHLIQEEFFHPYHEFGPDGSSKFSSVTDFVSLTGDAEVVEIRVGENAPVDDMTLAEATREGLVAKEALVIAVEREENILTPKGQTLIRAGGLVTVLSPDGSADEVARAFAGEIETKNPE